MSLLQQMCWPAVPSEQSWTKYRQLSIASAVLWTTTNSLGPTVDPVLALLEECAANEAGEARLGLRDRYSMLSSKA